MKTLLLHALAACALFAPLHVAEAKKPKPPAPIHGFAVGTTLTYNVTIKESVSISGGVTNENAPIPKGFPDFAIGQAVTFKVGKKSELLAPKVNIPFKEAVTGAVNYAVKPGRSGLVPTASVILDAFSGQPTRIEMSYIQVKLVKRNVVTNIVTYEFH